MKKRNVLISLAVVLICVPYFIKVYSLVRLICYLTGLALLTIVLFIYKRNVLVNLLITITIIVATYFLDYFLILKNNIPIISYQVKSSKKVMNYYSLFYKIDVCNNTWNVDNFYQKGFSCDPNDLTEIGINDFLSSYESNKHQYMRIIGKISKIEGDNNIELQPYEVIENAKNGNVDFKSDITLKVPIKNEEIDINKLKIYDEITIVGKVKKVSKNAESSIYLFTDIVVIPSRVYDNYSFKIEKEKKCELDKSLIAETEDMKYYSSCLKSISIVYNKDYTYDLDYAILDERITKKDFLIKDKLSETDEIGNELYKLDQINVVSCKNQKEIIIGSKDLSLKNNYCDIEEESGV